MLLDKIIDLATDVQQPLSVLLRQCVLLGYELKNDSLKAWANQELNGYTEPDKIPEYRVQNAGATGVFNAGYAYPNVSRAIPSSVMEEPHRWAAEIVRLAEPVSAYERHLKSEGTLRYQWNGELIAYYQHAFMPEHVLVAAHQEIPISAIAGMLDTIRTRVLTMALEIKSEIGESDTDLKKVVPNSKEAEKVNHIVINQIYGGTVYMAGGHRGNWEDLRKALLTLGIGEGEIGELSQAIQQDGKTLGTRVKGWIAKSATKVLDHGVEASTTMGTTLLIDYIKRHLGIP